MKELNDIQVRVLGCLMEKKETTPDQYPLTLNALRNACNQKSSRSPVTNYSEGDVGHALRELESLGLVSEAWGSRVARYEHKVPQVLGLHSPGMALMATLMLRGPQTLGELKNHSHRMHAFDDLDDVQYAVQKLATHEPPLVIALPRLAGLKEERFAHLLSGEPDIAQYESLARKANAPAAGPSLARKNISSGSPYESVVGFSRAVRVGNTVVVSGTGPIGPEGETVGHGDIATQMRRCLQISIAALEELGGCRQDVIRTRTYLRHREDWEAASHVHGEFFSEIRPASTMLQVASMIDPDWLVETEMDAIIGSGAD
jgi:uncharacterized protein YceH (UPF0502 family)